MINDAVPRCCLGNTRHRCFFLKTLTCSFLDCVLQRARRGDSSRVGGNSQRSLERNQSGIKVVIITARLLPANLIRGNTRFFLWSTSRRANTPSSLSASLATDGGNICCRRVG